jgi:hypothetical protein
VIGVKARLIYMSVVAASLLSGFFKFVGMRDGGL